MKIKYVFKKPPKQSQINNLEYKLNILPNTKVLSIVLDGQNLELDLDTSFTEEEIIQTIKDFDVGIVLPSEQLFKFKDPKKLKNKTIYDELVNKNIIVKEQDGVYLYFGIMNKLYNSLCDYFKKKIIKLGAEEVYLPSLLSKETLERSEYIKNNLENCNFVKNYGQENSQEYDGILNPAACQPLYKCLNSRIDQTPFAYTGFARVFRYEGNSFKELSRLREYGIRELVFIGSEQEIVSFKQKCLNEIINIIKELGLTATIDVASDMFFTGYLSKTLYQLSAKSKLEVNLFLTQQEKIAAASLNDHNVYFSKKWNLKNKKGEYLHTFCVGFGIERWCYAILCQFGLDLMRWPTKLKNKLKF